MVLQSVLGTLAILGHCVLYLDGSEVRIRIASGDAICPYVFNRTVRGLRRQESLGRRLPAAGYPEMLRYDLRCSAVRNMERAGVSPSVAMQLTGHKTEAVYRPYAITSEADLCEGVDRLNDLAGTTRGDKTASSTKQTA